MNWRTPLLATLLALSVTSCNLLPQSNTVSEDAQLLTNQAPSPRGLGDPNAPVKISEYTDYQWPYCERFVRETLPQIITEYVDTGKVYIEVYDYPLMSIHPGALMAAQAANCAAERGQFHDMRLRIFEGMRNNEWRDGSIQALDLFTNYGTDLGFDRASYASCISSNRYLDQVRLDMQQAEQLGIRSTPSFVINGRLLLGAQPFEEFKRVIDYMISPP